MGIGQKMRWLRQTLFGDPARAFGSMSLVLLVMLAIAPTKNHFSEWRHYQHGYLDLIRGRADALTLRRHFLPGLKQIWLPEMSVVDRCTTCHVALKESSLVDVSTQPYRPHPPIPHSWEDYGCVVCHRGQGPATTIKEAHHSTLAWERPILPAKFLESGCGQCHLGRMQGTPQLNLGRQLLAHYGCVRCHTVNQPDGTRMVASDDPPSLAHIADKTSRQWIYAWIKNPQAYAATATMPNFQLSDDDARDVSAFLIAQSTPLPALHNNSGAKPAAVNADPMTGASLYGESFCASCHAVQNAAGALVGGDVGPELTRIGSKAKPEWLAAWLRNPSIYDPGTKMPHYRFEEKQVAILTGFLRAKTDGDLLANVHLTEATPDQIQHGKRLVNEYGCASCHEISGIRRPDNFAPDLSRLGSRSLAVLAFPPGVPHTLPDYVGAKVSNPRAFGPGLKMPQYTLTEQQRDAITTALLSLTDESQTEAASLRIAAVQESNYQPAGKAGQLIHDLRCFTCHAINGRGGDMAPDLSWEGSSVQRAWLADFLRNPETLRPTLIRRMPKFNLTAEEVNTLTDYMMIVYQRPAFDRDSMPVSSFTPAMADQGRQLFYSKYACQSCHIVDPQKDKGYIGPALWNIGARMNAAWIFQYLKDPQALRPATIEPNQHMSDNDARALTAFLMTQKKSSRQQVARK